MKTEIRITNKKLNSEVHNKLTEKVNSNFPAHILQKGDALIIKEKNEDIHYEVFGRSYFIDQDKLVIHLTKIAKTSDGITEIL